MKGHATMGFFSRLMGGSDEQKTATSEFEILAPVSGELVHLEKTNDPAFRAYRTKCVSTLGASAQVDAPFSAV